MIIEIGTSIDRLTIISEVKRNGNHRVWECRCECGEIKNIRNDHLLKNEAKPCACTDNSTPISKICPWCGVEFKRRKKEEKKNWMRRTCCCQSHGTLYAHKLKTEISGDSIGKRFSDKYDVDTTTGCWMWNGTGNIYGKIRGKGGRYSSFVSAHRMSYELHNGAIPDGLCVLHKCDTPRCVNPDHLFLGTHQDNTDDMMKKGREKHGGLKRGKN